MLRRTQSSYMCMWSFLIDDYWSGYSTMSPTSSPGKKLRKAPKSADKVLDAPNLANDFCK